MQQTQGTRSNENLRPNQKNFQVNQRSQSPVFLQNREVQQSTNPSKTRKTVSQLPSGLSQNQDIIQVINYTGHHSPNGKKDSRTSKMKKKVKNSKGSNPSITITQRSLKESTRLDQSPTVSTKPLAIDGRPLVIDSQNQSDLIDSSDDEDLFNQEHILRSTFTEMKDNFDSPTGIKKSEKGKQDKLKQSLSKSKNKLLTNTFRDKIILNLSRCHYPVITEVIQNEFPNIAISRADNFYSHDWDIFWQDGGIESEKLKFMKPYQKINHFPAMFLIARKTFLAKNLKKMQKLFADQYDFFPRTWILPNEINDLRFNYQNSAIETFETKQEKSKLNQSQKSRFPQFKLLNEQNSKGFAMIVKPDQLSQGKGIYLTTQIDDLREISNPSQGNDKYVVQEYIKDPYLIDGLKFDIRLYVLVTSAEPLKIFLFQDGLVRFATEKYSNKMNSTNMQNMFVHLTNYSLNKMNPGFKNSKSLDDDSGHKRSWLTVLRRLEQEGCNIKEMNRKIKDIIVKTLLTIQPDLFHNYRSCRPREKDLMKYPNQMCFELLGFDILLDKKCKPYLLEVNHAPSFVCDAKIDQQIKYQLIKDTLVLLNMDIQARRNIIQMTEDERQLRNIGYQKKGSTKEMSQRQLLDKQTQNLAYQQKNKGAYELIYPMAVVDPDDENQRLIYLPEHPISG